MVPPEEVQVRNDVVFGSGGGRDLRCDVYSPPGAAGGEPPGRPAVVLVHGGAWRSGTKQAMQGYGIRLAQAGYVGVACEYRLNGEASWPAHIHDVKAAIRWTRANAAELGADPGPVAMLGRSAGAHLALLAAGTPNHPELEGDGGNAGVDTSVAAVVGIYSPTVFYSGSERTRGASPASTLLGEAPTAADVALASPVSHVSAQFPPTFLLHGTEDRVVPPSASIVMYDALVAAKAPVELHMYAGQPHGFVSRRGFLDLTATEIVHFLNRAVTAPATAEPAPPTAEPAPSTAQSPPSTRPVTGPATTGPPASDQASPVA